MATPQQRRKQRSGSKNTRRTANKYLKKVTIKGNAIIKANWDKKLTLRQNYEKLGLLTSLNGTAGGREKLFPDKKPETTDEEDLKELTEEDVEKVRKTLKPGEGLIQRDDEGNIVRIIVGEAEKTHDEILDEEVPPVEAKTDVVRALEAQAANGVVQERRQTHFEQDWVAKLIEKHGEDYEAMFWDKELNVYQQSVGQLKRKCQAYRKQHHLQ
ncbi:ribosome biogenesis protein Nop16 [Radiomyces spectabilis]|uniref:ribosome biogenesis protein Nop16 n=1 Tax=Radiomyces spectabilis TaxID=64574 RepID=UPI00221F66E2|nr:ribosome biogenesis protein Nop16 [Radiomyces spectabilis]KAI8364693.1 ribosome biogenesis protein Nop16 [Radiomyces spectabilis]